MVESIGIFEDSLESYVDLLLRSERHHRDSR